jgi:hypothetical protein
MIDDVDSLGTVEFAGLNPEWILHQNAHGKVYDIDISNDGQTWSTVYSKTKRSGGIEVIDLTENSGRYIRMYGHERGTQWGYSLLEFKVLGDPLTQLSHRQLLFFVGAGGQTGLFAFLRYPRWYSLISCWWMYMYGRYIVLLLSWSRQNDRLLRPYI